MATLEKTCNWKLTKVIIDKVIYRSECGLERTFVNGKIYNLYRCPKCGLRVKKGK